MLPGSIGYVAAYNASLGHGHSRSAADITFTIGAFVIDMDINKPRYTPMSRRRRIYEGKAKVLYEGPEPGTLI